MRILVDTNVVLDFLQERQPFVEHAARLFERIDTGEIEGFIAATTITNIYYISTTLCANQQGQKSLKMQLAKF